MIRTQIYLTEAERSGIELVAQAQGRKQSEIIRTAVDDLLARQGTGNRKKILDEIAGMWAAKNNLPDIRKLRAGWSRRAHR